MANASASEPKRESDVVGTLMSLTVAFTLAMAFRGFVLEGFVIPTGSMGPTLMGAHMRVDSPLTGYEYAADVQPPVQLPNFGFWLFDPMLSQRRPLERVAGGALAGSARAGDRVLVLKPLFVVSDPRRWDVVVFKNPTDPVGDTQNYIKRLVGLPGESFALLDGDVFTGPPGCDPDTLAIQRKPEHVQRAVWQPVYDSDFQPVVPADALSSALRQPWAGPPWRARGQEGAWRLSPARAWRFEGSGATTLDWRGDAWPVDDWNAYNALRYSIEFQALANPMQQPPADWWRGGFYAVSDLRLAASVECADMPRFRTEFELRARRQIFRFSLAGDGRVSVRRTVAETGEEREHAEFTFAPRTDGTLDLEFWHVDQQLWVFVNRALVGQLPYAFASMRERLEASLHRTESDPFEKLAEPSAPAGPVLSWAFDTAAPFTLHRVRVDRDLYYRPQIHSAANQVNDPVLSGPAFGTDWRHPAQLGPDDFLMLGDNSSHSRDSRLWGHAHRLAVESFGDSQPGVVPRPMIVGKAWCVYFPAPMPMSPGGVSLIPDFGRVRFIR
jgi:signal peptidase I